MNNETSTTEQITTLIEKIVKRRIMFAEKLMEKFDSISDYTIKDLLNYERRLADIQNELQVYLGIDKKPAKPEKQPKVKSDPESDVPEVAEELPVPDFLTQSNLTPATLETSSAASDAVVEELGET